MHLLSVMTSKAVCRVGGGFFDRLRPAFPKVVRIETTNACNASCVICPHKQIQRPISRMDNNLYTRIIDQCAAAGCQEVHLHNFGEPLMDKQLEDRVSDAKKKGIKKVKIFSNGSLLSASRAKGLIEAGLDEIKISIDGATKEEFERIRVPLRFETVMQNIYDLVAMRNACGSGLIVLVACCSTADKQATMQPLINIADGFSFNKIHNWGNGDQTNGRSRLRKPCCRLWRNLTVLAGGDVSLCCLDYDGQHILGRVDENASIGEIWNSPAYENVRRLHKEGRQNSIQLCANCTKSFV
jgi:hypothetical protein